MPIYEYRCNSCGHDFEALVSMSAPNPDCESCGASSDEVAKKVSAAGFLLKGSGWYKDHYGLKKSTPAPSEAGGSESKTSSASPSEGSGGGSTTAGE